MWWIVAFLGSPAKASVSLPGKPPTAPPSSSLLSLLLFVAKTLLILPFKIPMCLLRWLLGFPVQDSNTCIGMSQAPGDQLVVEDFVLRINQLKFGLARNFLNSNFMW